jgi:hypothetical protein
MKHFATPAITSAKCVRDQKNVFEQQLWIGELFQLPGH